MSCQLVRAWPLAMLYASTNVFRFYSYFICVPDVYHGCHKCVWPHLCFVFPCGFIKFLEVTFVCSLLRRWVQSLLPYSLFYPVIYRRLASWFRLAVEVGTVNYPFRSYAFHVLSTYVSYHFFYLFPPFFLLSWELMGLIILLHVSGIRGHALAGSDLSSLIV